MGITSSWPLQMLRQMQIFTKHLRKTGVNLYHCSPNTSLFALMSPAPHPTQSPSLGACAHSWAPAAGGGHPGVPHHTGVLSLKGRQRPNCCPAGIPVYGEPPCFPSGMPWWEFQWTSQASTSNRVPRDCFFSRFSAACLDYLFNKGRQPMQASPAISAAVRVTPVWAAWGWAGLLRAPWAHVASLVSNNTSQLTCVCRGSILDTWLLPSWHRQVLEIRKILISLSNVAGTSQRELGIQEIQNTNLILLVSVWKYKEASAQISCISFTSSHLWSWSSATLSPVSSFTQKSVTRSISTALHGHPPH